MKITNIQKLTRSNPKISTNIVNVEHLFYFSLFLNYEVQEKSDANKTLKCNTESDRI